MSLFEGFPRKVGVPEQRTVKTKEEMLDIVNSNNGHTDLYASVFSDNQKMFGNLDKIPFDIDKCDHDCNNCNESKASKCSVFSLQANPETLSAYDNMVTLHNALWQDDTKHIIGFSGGGYHIYAAALELPLRNPNPALRNFASKYIKQHNIKADTSVFEVSRIMRFPKTYNLSKQKWFVWLDSTDIANGSDWIEKLADEQQDKDPEIFGSKKIDLKPHDKAELDHIATFQKYDIEKIGLSINDIQLWPCIRRMLANPYMNYRQRYLTILFFKEKGIGMKDVVEILKQHLSTEKFQHCLYEEGQPKYIYRNDNLMFPKCENLKREGLCEYECEFKNSMYY